MTRSLLATLGIALETLSQDTWEHLRDANALSIRFGEETITDLLLLDIKRRALASTKVKQTSKSKESQQGTDFEWWLGANQIGWMRFAVQAKKLEFKSDRYPGVTHKVKTDMQIDVLEEYALVNNAVPLYCLYNFTNYVDPSEHWNCCQRSFQIEQLGCTIAPLSTIRKTIGSRGTKNFDFLHGFGDAIPWRCLAICPRIRKQFYRGRQSSSMVPGELPPLFDTPPRIYDSPPQVLRDENPTEMRRLVQASELEQSGLYDQDVGYPRRICRLEFSQEEISEILSDG